MQKLDPNSPPKRKIPPLQRGILALSRHDYPHALAAFGELYRNSDWITRDLAVTSLSDLLDSRIVEGSKPLSSSMIAGWKPPRPRRVLIPKHRLLVLVEHFTQPSLCRPQNLAEYRTLRTLQATKEFLQKILLNDPEQLVRFSASVVLNEYFDGERRHLILPALNHAYHRESEGDLKLLLREFLGSSAH